MRGSESKCLQIDGSCKKWLLRTYGHSKLKNQRDKSLEVCIFNLEFCVQKLDVDDETNYLLQSAVNALMGRIYKCSPSKYKG